MHNIINQYLFTDIVLSRGVSNKVLFLHHAFKNLLFFLFLILEIIQNKQKISAEIVGY